MDVVTPGGTRGPAKVVELDRVPIVVDVPNEVVDETIRVTVVDVVTPGGTRVPAKVVERDRVLIVVELDLTVVVVVVDVVVVDVEVDVVDVVEVVEVVVVVVSAGGGGAIPVVVADSYTDAGLSPTEFLARMALV